MSFISYNILWKILFILSWRNVASILCIHENELNVVINDDVVHELSKEKIMIIKIFKLYNNSWESDSDDFF